MAAAGAARFRSACVSGKSQLRIKVQAVHRQSALQAGNQLAAHASFHAFGAHQRRHFVGRVSAFRVDGDGGAACIVAVKAVTCAGIKLGLVPRAKNQVELGADFGVSTGSGVCNIVAFDSEVKPVNPHTRDCTKFVCPLRRVVKIQSQTALIYVVSTRGGHNLAGNAVTQRIVDVVVLKLQASSIFGAASPQFGRPRMAGIDAGSNAPVGLCKLVAIYWGVQKIREV